MQGKARPVIWGEEVWPSANSLAQAFGASTGALRGLIENGYKFKGKSVKWADAGTDPAE